MNIYNQFLDDLKILIYGICERVSRKEITIDQAFALANEKHDELVYKYEHGNFN